MPNNENQPTVDIGAVEVALALSAVTGFMIQNLLQRPSLSPVDTLVLGTGFMAFIASTGAALFLATYYVRDRVFPLTFEEMLEILRFGRPFSSREAHILLVWAVCLFYVALGGWVFLTWYKMLL